MDHVLDRDRDRGRVPQEVVPHRVADQQDVGAGLVGGPQSGVELAGGDDEVVTGVPADDSPPFGSGCEGGRLGIGAALEQLDSRHRFVIGSRRSLPKPFGEIFVPGGYCRRLYSAVSTIRSVFVTRAASNPAATMPPAMQFFDAGRAAGATHIVVDPRRTATAAGSTAHLQPLPGQVLTEEDQRRLQHLGANGDTIDPSAWGTWTSSVKNHQATAEEVLGGMPAPAAAGLAG